MTHPRSILIVGGTFDPPHRGHVELPRLAAERLGCDSIIYVPAAQNPLKSDPPCASDEDRVAMVRLAIAGIDGAEVSTIEIDRAGRSWFVETLEELARRFRGAQLHFVIGADNALSFAKWREPARILELARPAVLLRPPWTAGAFERALAEIHSPQHARWWRGCVIDAPLVDVSASDLRTRLREGRDISDMDPAVVRYVRARGLYGATENAS